MEQQLLENIIIYSFAALLCIVSVTIYLRMKKKESGIVDGKIRKAKEEGLHEPVSLHPYIDNNACIGTGACVAACPEKDILGLSDGKAVVINASQCVGHGACFHACPTQAISLRIGTEKRGVDLPHVSRNFETNVQGIFIAGELGGMGLIKNAAEQGKLAVENIAKSIKKDHNASFDLIIIGAGPAGISGALEAKKQGLNFLLLEQDTLGGTVFTYPRQKVVMTSPMDLPLYGKIRLYETSKSELLDLWQKVINSNSIKINEHSGVDSLFPEDGLIKVKTVNGDLFTSAAVLLAIGRRGTPRKLNVPGEEKEKVAYRLLEPEIILGKNILVVGGGDSAIESALLLAGHNHVTLSYRNEVFSRIKPKNRLALNKAIEEGKLEIRLNSNVVKIEDDYIILDTGGDGTTARLKNDLVFIFAGGEMPAQLLEKAGIRITRRFGETVLQHKR